MSKTPAPVAEPDDGLSIGDLAERTGVPAATLRSWESRYGAPRPLRLPGGHRRYIQRDVDMVREVLRLRGAGLGLSSAIVQAAADAERPEVSVFAALRRRHPELVPNLLHKDTMLALSHAIEDEYCAEAERPVLLGGFQHLRFYQASRARWQELARTAEIAVIVGDFPLPVPAPGPPWQVPLPADAPALREWTLICEAPDYPACLAGWERPCGRGEARRFEAVWSVDPRAVRHAAQAYAEICRPSAPQLAGALAARVGGAAPPPTPDLVRASGLLNRMIGYLEDRR